MKIFIAFGLLLCTSILSSCYFLRVEGVPVNWIYRGNRDGQALALAVIEEDTAKIEELVGSGKVDVDEEARDGTRPLRIAISLGKKRSYVTLLDLGADIYSGNHSNSVAFFAAGYFAEVAGDLFYLEEALKRGFDPNFRLSFLSNGLPIVMPLKAPPSGYAAHGTMHENYLAKLKLLLSYGADPNISSMGPIKANPYGFGSGVVVRAAMDGYFNAVYYLLTEVEGVQYKDFKYLNVETNEYDEVKTSVLKEIEDYANADSWYVILGRIQEFTYPWFIKTIEWLEARGEVLDIPEDLSRILTIGRDQMDHIRHYTIDKDGVIRPAEPK